LVEPSSLAAFRMRMFNADGSEAEMCGNGLRCFARYIYEEGLYPETSFDVETKAGLRRVELEVEQEKIQSIRVQIGQPQWERFRIPMKGIPEQGYVLEEALAVENRTFWGSAVSMGNPHLVIFLSEVEDFPVSYWGPLLEKNPLFPEGINVEFVEQRGTDLFFQRTWERGCGETFACGTGASAVAVVAHQLGKASRRSTIQLKGGALEVEWSESQMVWLKGTAQTIFHGEIP
jgi:diaminopimelate epimerase